MEKNAKIGTFFYKDWKIMQRSEHSFIKNGEEHKDRSVLLQYLQALVESMARRLQVVIDRGGNTTKY